MKNYPVIGSKASGGRIVALIATPKHPGLRHSVDAVLYGSPNSGGAGFFSLTRFTSEDGKSWSQGSTRYELEAREALQEMVAQALVSIEIGGLEGFSFPKCLFGQGEGRRKK